MYVITATAPNGTSANQPEVLGDAHRALFTDREAAEERAEELRAEDMHPGVVYEVTEDCRDLEAEVAAHLETIDVPDGASWHVDVIDDGERIEAIVVTLRTEALCDEDAWIAAEDAVDLGFLGLEFFGSGGLGGPWAQGGVNYVAGTYQRWVLA